MTAPTRAVGPAHVIMALATFVSMVIAQTPRRAGESLWQLLIGWPADPARLLPALPFAATLMAVLLAHELGHMAAARAVGAPLPPPWLIPAPMFFFGTLGAVIPSRGPMPDRSSLLRMALAGPLAGLLVALPAAVWGLHHSTQLADQVAHGQAGMMLGDSLLFAACERWFAPGGGEVILHPVALAAWAGLFFTSLNLLPIGQLDGGHVVYALNRRLHRIMGRGVLVLLILLGLGGAVRGDGAQAWWVWALLLAVMGLGHPQVAQPARPLAGGDRRLACLALLLWLATFVPVPVRQVAYVDAATDPPLVPGDEAGEEIRL